MARTPTAEHRYAPDLVLPPGETLVEVIAERGMTQAELAGLVGVGLGLTFYGFHYDWLARILPSPAVLWGILLLILGSLGAVLMLGGTLTTTYLALSDARPDLATLGAVGAAPRTCVRGRTSRYVV